MSAWPSIAAPVFPLSENREDGVIRSAFEAGYEQTRRRFTRCRKTFGLKWSVLSAADKSTLMTFFDTTTGGGADSFTWTYPGTATTYTVRFTGPPKVALVANGLYEVELELREV